MRCLSPRTVGFQADGKTLSWSPKKSSKEYATFQLPCTKCLECRLEYGRSTAIRCVHEAQMHPENSFITLTYSDANLKSGKLHYPDFQEFIKAIRAKRFTGLLQQLNMTEAHYLSLPKETRQELYKPIQMGVFVTGEYGEKKKRPHWHALLFNYRPKDLCYRYTNDTGDKIYTSQEIDTLWGKNDPDIKPSEIGDVTFHSAGYCARYAAKKLVHGKDQDHEFHPVHKRSCKNAIGKSFLEKYYKDIFNYGYVILPNGQKCGVPRYYEKWLSKHHPEDYIRYVTEVKTKQWEKGIRKAEKEKSELSAVLNSRGIKSAPITRNQARKKILEQKFEKLQKYLKGDI